ncbi:MAG: type I-E CRISPR-associated protein Cas7/Cse4/CasC [Sedimenticola sp.]
MTCHYSLLDEPLIRARGVDSGEQSYYSLPGLFVAMQHDQIRDFPALRPHQRHPWHAFLVQLAAIALHNYPAALLNREDAGLAKRLPMGDAVRTRITSQCLKRHWRVTDDRYALSELDVPMAHLHSSTNCFGNTASINSGAPDSTRIRPYCRSVTCKARTWPSSGTSAAIRFSRSTPG